MYDTKCCSCKIAHFIHNPLAEADRVRGGARPVGACLFAGASRGGGSRACNFTKTKLGKCLFSSF